LKLDLAVARHLMSRKARGVARFPLVTMLEPLEACNLACIGCGRVREYRDVIDKRLTVDECLAAVRASGAPIVSISGGEPLLHRQIGEIARAILDDRRFIYLCTNGLLLREALDAFAPSVRLRIGRRSRRSARRSHGDTASARTRRSSTARMSRICTLSSPS